MRRIGLAVSGGADSVALLVLLAELRQKLDFDAVVLHVDHSIRADSAEDARFVKELSARYSLPFHSVKVKIVRKRGESLEMAARRERLAFFAVKSAELHLDAIATGHHADDVAETFLLRLARGSGADGLAGLKRISRLQVPVQGVGELPLVFIRPLLDIRDRQLREFLEARGVSWREDSTNSDVSIPRNRVRHMILPYLRENFDERITEHICKTAAILRGDLSLPEVAEPIPPKKKSMPGNYQLTISPAEGFVRRKASNPGELPAECELSRASLAGRTLELRLWREGDRIRPIGMNGRSRKLQDVFVTAKVPVEVRSSLPVLADAKTGEILWIPGYRIAESAAVSPDAPSWRFRLVPLSHN